MDSPRMGIHDSNSDKVFPTETPGVFQTVSGQKVSIAEHTDKTYYFTAILSPDRPATSMMLNTGIGQPLPSSLNYEHRRATTIGDTNWTGLGDSFVWQAVDCTLAKGRDEERLSEALSKVRLTASYNSLQVMDHVLHDLLALDSALEDRVARIETWIAKFMELQEPLAESMRRLGWQPLAHDYRVFKKPLLLMPGGDFVLMLNADDNLPISADVILRIRMRGIQKRLVR